MEHSELLKARVMLAAAQEIVEGIDPSSEAGATGGIRMAILSSLDAVEALTALLNPFESTRD